MRDFILSDLTVELFVSLVLLLELAGLALGGYAVRASLPSLSDPTLRRVGWWRLLLLLPIALLPFWNLTMAAILTPALGILGWGMFQRLWTIRALGADGYRELLNRVASSNTRPGPIPFMIVGMLFLLLSSAVLWILSPDPRRDWGYWFAISLAWVRRSWGGRDRPRTHRLSAPGSKEALPCAP